MTLEFLSDHVVLSRMQFAITAMFHILWPVLIVGLSIFVVYLEAAWLRTRDDTYYHHARFWTKLFLLTTAVGVVTGIPMEFQFGSNWGPFSVAGGDHFGHMLGFEAAMAFMLEASFLGIMVFGWRRVSPRMHLLATAMVAFGASLSAFWIMVANSWMHTPTGGHFENGRFVLESHTGAIFSPDMPWGVSHMWTACLEITVFVIGGVSAWYLLRRRHVPFFLKSFKIALLAAIAVTPLQIFLGDGSGGAVMEHQPIKLAAIEAHWYTNPPGKGAEWNIIAWPDKSRQDNVWAIAVPNALSLIATKSMSGQIKGLREFPPEHQPPVAVSFYAFRIMTFIGFGLFFIMLWSLWAWYRGGLGIETAPLQRKLLYAWIGAIPLSYLAMETGWITREVGRQPWILYGLMRTEEAATVLPTSSVVASLSAFGIVYTLLFVLFLVFAKRILVRGPDIPE